MLALLPACDLLGVDRAAPGAFAAAVADQDGGGPADQGAEEGEGEEHDDHRRVEAGEEDFEGDLLGVLEGDDDDEGDEDEEEPAAPVDFLVFLRADGVILEAGAGLNR